MLSSNLFWPVLKREKVINHENKQYCIGSVLHPLISRALLSQWKGWLCSQEGGVKFSEKLRADSDWGAPLALCAYLIDFTAWSYHVIFLSSLLTCMFLWGQGPSYSFWNPHGQLIVWHVVLDTHLKKWTNSCLVTLIIRSTEVLFWIP